jgi:hypothetical protein
VKEVAIGQTYEETITFEVKCLPPAAQKGVKA